MTVRSGHASTMRDMTNPAPDTANDPGALTVLYRDSSGRPRDAQCRGRHCQVLNCRSSLVGPSDVNLPVNLPDTFSEQVIVDSYSGSAATRFGAQQAVAAVMARFGCARSDLRGPLGGDCTAHQVSQAWTEHGCSLAVDIVTQDCHLPLQTEGD